MFLVYGVKIRQTCWLANEDALDVDRLNKVAEQGSLVSKHLPLSQLVCCRHARHLRGGMSQGWRKNWEHLERKKINLWLCRHCPADRCNVLRNTFPATERWRLISLLTCHADREKGFNRLWEEPRNKGFLIIQRKDSLGTKNWQYFWRSNYLTAKYPHLTDNPNTIRKV